MSEEEGQASRVLIIAGSDSSGGAGIQADIKTVTALGGYAMTAVTALTVQNTTGVFDVIPAPVNAVIAQATACLSDIGADAIKTGMLGSRPLIEAISELLSEQGSDRPRIIDPVMVATSGDRLLDLGAVDVLRSLLVPGATLVTPNAPEAEILTGKSVETVDGQRRAAEALLERGAEAALVKGGHIAADPITDVLQTQSGEWLLEMPRIATDNTHGTGCTLASAIATEMAFSRALPQAVEAAQHYLAGAIKASGGWGSGPGPVNHAWRVKRY
ncbi:MAG: bifunctional hydroxymethylpyrimidine kinase/phosphomethylpyrimidine kinase [Pseudomonadota bacterium]